MGFLKGHLRRRRDLHRDRPLPLAVEDLLRAAGVFADLGHALQRHQLPARCYHRQAAEVLRTLHETILAFDHQVDAVGSEVVVGRVAAVDEAVDHVAELPGVKQHVGRLFPLRHKLHLGAGEIERRLGQVLAARRRLSQHPHHLAAEAHQLCQIRPGDLHVDGPPGSDPLLKQARLLGNREGARQVGSNRSDQRDQLGGGQRIESSQPEKHAFPSGNKEEVAEHGVVEGGGLWRAWLHIPVGQQPLLHDIAHPQQLVKVVARRRQQDAKHEVAVAFREVLNLWQEGEGGPHRQADNRPCTSDLPCGGRQKEVEAAREPGEEKAAQSTCHVALAGRLRLSSREQPGSCGGHHQHRHNQREAHGRTDRQRDISKELTRLLLDKQHRQKHRHGGERACQHRTPDLLGTADGR